jgi:hypothetical protein
MQASAAAAAEHVDNFRLTDHKGVAHELYYYADMKAVVLLAQGNGCAASAEAVSALAQLGDKHTRGVAFFAINSNVADTREDVAKQANTSGIQMPILLDQTQLIGESLNLTQNGEVLVLDPRGWQVVYRGAGNTHAVVAAIDAVIAGAAVKERRTPFTGCRIATPERDRAAAPAQISYQGTIAPLLLEKCVTCHRDGGIAPWQMNSYETVRGFAPMIREVVRTKRMPPWHADPHYGSFSNDRSLSNQEARQLVHWIEAGAPRGNGTDPLKYPTKQRPEWQLGDPDVVLELPAFTVPATGTLPYENVTADNPLDHDAWVRAVDFLPGNRTVVHHITATIGGEGIDPFEGDGALGDYVPGAAPIEAPAGSGTWLPKGSIIFFEVHYTTTGKQTIDTTRVGLYLLKEPPQYRYREATFTNTSINIPVHTNYHEENASRTFKRDVLIYSLRAHAHLRGRAARFEAIYPDGRHEILLNVPAYDFNWQSTYLLATPQVLPAGTKVTYYTAFDNSAQNKSNPDPDRSVPWGLQSWDEMLYGAIRFRYWSGPDAVALPPTSAADN